MRLTPAFRRLFAGLLVLSVLATPARAGDVKKQLLERARTELLAKLEKTEPKLAGWLKDVDAETWGRYAGEISAGNARAVVDELYEKKKEELLKDLYEKGKARAIESGVMGADTETYIGWAETYGADLQKMAARTFTGDFKGAGDVLLGRMRDEAQAKAQEYLQGETVKMIDFFLKDIAGQSVGAVYFKILEWEKTKIEEFEKYTIQYFGTISASPKGKRVERTWCEQYAAMRDAGHDPYGAFDGQNDKTGVGESIAHLVTLGGQWYSTSRGVGLPDPKGTPPEDKAGYRPDDQTMRKQLELCYMRIRLPNKAALEAAVQAKRTRADALLFGKIKEGMDDRKRRFILILNESWPKLPSDFALVVSVVATGTGDRIAKARVTLDGEIQEAPSGQVSYARTLDMLSNDKSADSIEITAEAEGYDPKTVSFTIGTLANRFDVAKREVPLQLTLAPEKGKDDKGKKKDDKGAAADIDVYVTVEEQDGGKIKDATARFDTERKDTTDGVATFLRASDALHPGQGERTVTLEAEAPDHEPASVSYSLAELSGKIDRDRNRLDLRVVLKKKEKEKKKPVDEVVRLEVACAPESIAADEAAICSATAHLKSGATLGVTADAAWEPAYVERSKGTVRGAEVQAAHALPHKLAVKASWSSPDYGGKPMSAEGSVSVRSGSGPPKPAIRILVTPNRATIAPGDTVTYGYQVSNVGNVTLQKIAVKDDTCSPLTSSGGDANADGILDLTETWSFGCDVALNADTTNTATTSGVAPDGTSVSESAKATVKVAKVGPCPAPRVSVPEVRQAQEGDAIETLGKVPLHGVVVHRQDDDTTPAGTVLDQKPRAPECVDAGSTVELWVSQRAKDDKKDDDGSGGKGNKGDPQNGTGATLSAELDCGKSFELAPGDFVGRTCGIIVRNWISDSTERVTVTVEYQRDSGIEVSIGDTSAPPDLMYTAGVSDTHDRYVFSETFRAKDDAEPGKTTVALSVSQKGAGTVTLLVEVAVLRKGLLPSNGPGIRPPADVKTGSGGDYCVWRHKLVGDPPPCFHFAAAPCDSDRYTTAKSVYELVGTGMTWGEADARVQELSSYHDDKYGCRAAGSGIVDTDGDGVPDNQDGCPTNPDKQAAGACGCQQPDTDSDTDGAADCVDGCEDDAEKTAPGKCGCGVADRDGDSDGTPDCLDNCPQDGLKTEPGLCDCGIADDDSDGDGTLDCYDKCPKDRDKISEEYCGCGKPETDTDHDRWPDCIDACPNDGTKSEDVDSDGDGPLDCNDECPRDPSKTKKGSGGCAQDTAAGSGSDSDTDGHAKAPVDPNIGQRFGDREHDRNDRNDRRRTADAFSPKTDKDNDLDGQIDDLIDKTRKDDGPTKPPGPKPPAPSNPPTPPAPPPPPPSNGPPNSGGLTDITVGVTPTALFVWDYSNEDLDRVDIYLDDQLVRGNLTILNARTQLTLYLKPGPNRLTVKALNIGDPQLQIDWNLLPFNSAAIEIQGVKVGNSQQQWRLDAGATGSMTITYQP